MGTIQLKPYKDNNPVSKSYGKWFVGVDHNKPLTVEELCKHIELDSKIERTKVVAVTSAIVKQMEEHLANGHPIVIPYLGTLKLSVESAGAASATAFNAAHHIKRAKVLLVPDTEIKAELRNLKFEKFYYEDALQKKQARDAAREAAEEQGQGTGG